MDPEIALRIWKAALEAEIGVGFKFLGAAREFVRDQMYKARAASGDPTLQNLIMFLPADSDEIFICKKQQDSIDA